MSPRSCGPAATNVSGPSTATPPAVAGFAMAGVALVGVVVQLARDGDPTPYAVICAVGGLAYTCAVVVLRRR